MIRLPAVAGQFYPSEPFQLRQSIEACFAHPLGSKKSSPIKAGIVPHAGYVYSGPCASHLYSRVSGFDTVILLGNNHTGLGPAVSASAAEAWETPLGRLPVDKRLLVRLPAVADNSAHQFEHSIEVQLPFLQTRLKKFSIAPVAIQPTDQDAYKKLGEAIASTVSQTTLLLATTDFSHYVPPATAKARDALAIEKILALDATGLEETVMENSISMCGLAPVCVFLHAAKKLKLKGKLLSYYTSDDITPSEKVVGYGAIGFT